MPIVLLEVILELIVHLSPHILCKSCSQINHSRSEESERIQRNSNCPNRISIVPKSADRIDPGGTTGWRESCEQRYGHQKSNCAGDG